MDTGIIAIIAMVIMVIYFLRDPQPGTRNLPNSPTPTQPHVPCHPAAHDWGISGFTMFNPRPTCKICGAGATDIG